MAELASSAVEFVVSFHFSLHTARQITNATSVTGFSCRKSLASMIDLKTTCSSHHCSVQHRQDLSLLLSKPPECDFTNRHQQCLLNRASQRQKRTLSVQMSSPMQCDRRVACKPPGPNLIKCPDIVVTFVLFQVRRVFHRRM